jgi:squamous cell carcinoma antigen recognized by T-cells 3
MDESQSLDALANLLNQLSEKPYNTALHAQHIRLTQSSDVLQPQIHAAREMYTNCLAAEEDIWIPLINEKESEVDINEKEGLEELLALYERAQSDYLCAFPFVHIRPRIFTRT